jgi:peptide deformylase
MIKSIVRDIKFLMIKSENMKLEDKCIIDDLKDTLMFNSHRCVGMAANMIGYHKNAIVFFDNNKKLQIMINPQIIKKDFEYEAIEGCLSLDGQRNTKRYKKIKVEYLDEEFRKRIKTYTDFEAQIILHEIDHTLGIII